MCLSQNFIFSQIYRFTGDPQIVIEEGNYKQVYNTGMYFYYDRDWELAIKFFSRCSDLTRKKTNTIHLLLGAIYILVTIPVLFLLYQS